jgi:hypothetical protein
MKNSRFLKGMLFFNASVFLLTILEFLALHDIAKDYLSRDALKFAEITAAIPAWTATEGEWLMVQASFFVQTLFLLLNLFLLYHLLRPKIAKNSEG